jgi:hypothetical protein
VWLWVQPQSHSIDVKFDVTLKNQSLFDRVRTCSNQQQLQPQQRLSIAEVLKGCWYPQCSSVGKTAQLRLRKSMTFVDTFIIIQSKYLRDFVIVLGISARGRSRVLFYLGQFPLDVIGVYLTCKLDE